MELRTVDQADVAGRRGLVRNDFNVPLEDGKVTDDLRIRAAVPTLRHLLDNGAKVICCSHLGRPKGKRDPKYSLAPVRPVLAELYVDDAFGAAHRAHASVVGVAERLDAYAGFLLASEVKELSRLLEDPERPFVAVLGGSKVSDKLAVLDNLLGRVDSLVVGGGMCFTFLAAQGHEIGDSLFEPDQVEAVRQLLETASSQGKPVLLPTDVVVAREVSEDAEARTVPASGIEAGWKGLDIGPETAKAFAA